MFGFFKKKKAANTSETTCPPESKGPVFDVLDECAERVCFPMLDNGYVYPAASRMTAYHGKDDWALVIEVFGFSPRAGHPDTFVYTFGSSLANRSASENWASKKAWENFLTNNPNNQDHTICAIENTDWIDSEDCEYVNQEGHLTLRGRDLRLPSLNDYKAIGIEVEDTKPLIFELCRYLAYHHRECVLATEEERRFYVPEHLVSILTLDDWTHIDLAEGELPSELETFRQLQTVVMSGNPTEYKLPLEGNTHWSNWPAGGAL